MKNLHENPAMPDTMLSEHYKYWSGYIAYADIQLAGLPESVVANGQELFKKEEFHISLIDTGTTANLVNPQSPEKAELEIIEDFQKFIKQESLEQFRLLEQFRFVTQEDRRTVVVMCQVPGADKFFAELSQKYGTEIPLQPFHITLYTLPGGRGIGIASEQELNEITVPVDVPELANIKPA